MIKARLFTPGPTDVPPEVLIEMARPIFHHRTARFREMFAEVNAGLKKILQTANDVITIAGSLLILTSFACFSPVKEKIAKV